MKFGLQYWSDSYRLIPPPRKFVYEAAEFGLKRGCTYGLRTFTGKLGSLFSFSGRSVEHNMRIEVIMHYIVPHLHQAMIRVLNHEKRDQKSPRGLPAISIREKEILNWLMQGKSSWDISLILKISERTVNFHVYNIMKKLDAVSRAQAVAAALHLGLIDFE